MVYSILPVDTSSRAELSMSEEESLKSMMVAKEVG